MTTTITDVHTVGVSVTDQDAALAFYTELLGFETRLDAPISDTIRWIEVAAADATTTIALIPGDPLVPVDAGIRFTASDAAAERSQLAGRGVTVGELLVWDGVPPMFTFDDPDGNRFYVIEAMS